MTVSFAHYQRSLQYQKKEEKKPNIRSIFEPVKPSIQAIHKPSIQTSQWVPVAWPPPFDLRSLSALWPPGPFTSRPFGLPALWPPKKKDWSSFVLKRMKCLQMTTPQEVNGLKTARWPPGALKFASSQPTLQLLFNFFGSVIIRFVNNALSLTKKWQW